MAPLEIFKTKKQQLKKQECNLRKYNLNVSIHFRNIAEGWKQHTEINFLYICLKTLSK